MGQYYSPVLQQENKKKIEVYTTTVNGEFHGMKIMEHSWLENDLLGAIAFKIYKNPSRVAWCGDYAEDDELKALNPSLSYRYIREHAKELKDVTILKQQKNMYLINHDKKIYIDLKRYSKVAEEFSKGTTWEGWVVHPLSLLTAVGNDRGGGDYHEGSSTTCFNSVGTWAWNLLSIDTVKPKGYIEEKHIIFTEQLNDDNKHLLQVYGLDCPMVELAK